MRLAKLWELGERCFMPVLQNKVLEVLYYMTRFEALASKGQLKEFVWVCYRGGYGDGGGRWGGCDA